MRRGLLWGALFVAITPHQGQTQEPVRAGMVGRAKVGKPAPEVVLNYFTANGPGPADQPFRLTAELGRVLVIVFGPAGELDWWRSVSAGADTAWSGAYLVGVVRDDPDVVGRVASLLSNVRTKLLADPGGQGWRRYGVSRNQRALFVVGDDGRIVLAKGQFDPSAATEVALVTKAVRDAGSR